MTERLTVRALLSRDPGALGGLPLPSAEPVCEACGPTPVDEPGIVHLGDDTGARVHLATYAQDLIRDGWPGRVHLVSLRGDSTERLLGPQDHLYSLTVSEPDRSDTVHVVSSIARASTGVDAAVEAVASPATRMVTVSDDEHRNPPEDWSDDRDDPSGSDPGGRPDGSLPIGGTHSIAEVLALGLAARDRNLPPPVVVSLDDVFMNGDVLRARVLDAASRIDEQLEEWIETEVEFPNSIIDRMVADPPTVDHARIESLLGMRDEAPLVTEKHRSWVIESVEGLPPLTRVGVESTRDIVRFERRRLWLVEGPRLALAHAGAFHGCATIAEAAAHPVAREFATRLSRAAVAVILMAAGGEPGGAPPGSTEAYADSVLRRLANPAVTRACVDVCSEGSRSIPMSVLPVADGLLIAGLGVTDHALLVAAWLAMASGMDVAGASPPLPEDPIGGYLYAAVSGGGTAALVDAAMAEFAVHDLPGFDEEVLSRLEHLVEVGPAAFTSRGSAVPLP